VNQNKHTAPTSADQLIDDTQSGAAPQPATVTPEFIAAFELQQLTAYYRAAHPALRSLSWNLLQTAISPQTRPVLLAFALALDLLENEDARAYHKERKDGETFPTMEAVIAGFLSGKYGVIDGKDLVNEATQEEREAITSAARVLFALPQQARLLEFAALEIPEPKEFTEADVEAMRRELEEIDTQQHLTRV
jgi:hypothetical protein